MAERREPTHVLTVEIPLRNDAELDFNPFQDAIALVLSLARLADRGAFCGGAEVTLREVEPS